MRQIKSLAIKLVLAVLSSAAIFSMLTLSSLSFSGEGHSHGEIHERVLFVTGSHSNKAKISLLKKIALHDHVAIDMKKASGLELNDKTRVLFESYQMVVFDGVSSRDYKMSFAKFAPLVAKSNTRFLPIKSLESKDLRKNITEHQAKIMFDYWDNGGSVNMDRMSDFTHIKIFDGSDTEVLPPVIYPQLGIYHPEFEGKVFNTLPEYLSWKNLDEVEKGSDDGNDSEANSDEPVIAILFQRALIESDQTYLIDETLRQIESRGGVALPFFFELSPRSSDYSHLLREGGRKNGDVAIDLIINYRAIHWANKRKEEFEALNVPVIQALTYYDGNQKKWEESAQGISPGMAPFVLVLPETAGVIDPVIVAAVNEKTERAEMIDYQLDYLLDRTFNYTNLRNKPNADKKIAVMFWGDKDMGASFLNVPESLQAISGRLSSEGYAVDAVDDQYFIDRVDQILNPFYREYELKSLLKDDLAELFPVAQYRAWFDSLPDPITKPVYEDWGEPEDNFMVVDYEGQKQFVIPRIRNGNMLVMRQPPRGEDKDKEQKLYHSTNMAINHYYLAAYYYTREVWGSDALVHLGTHGSQEYLPGKERGMSRYDAGNLAVGDMPVMYPFIVDDVGEAMQTKRRGNAVVVSHMTPPFAAAGLQEVTADLHALMHEYKALDEGGVKQKTAKQIVQICVDESICDDLDWQQAAIDKDFSGFLEALHDYLGELAAENQPLGLHSFGELSEERLLISTVTQMLGKEFIELATQFERDHDFEEHGHHHSNEADHDDHSHESDPHDKDEDHYHYHQAGDKLEDLAGFKTVRDFVFHDKESSQLSDELQVFIEKSREHHTNIKGIQELESLLSGLNGEYIPVKTGGDPIRHPESLPTGFNLYGFDPSRLPTKAAYEQGTELVEDVIAQYYQKHGEYPDKLAFSLWSIEAMRHYGVLESQALRAMGIKPKWSPDGRVIGTEIIPASELKRPRVDVVLSATGLYRDAFPNVMQMLAKAIKELAELKESGNSIWENAQRVKQQLIEEGIDEAEAEYLSSVRIFSNSSGNYGSGVDGPIQESETWEEDKKIADNYLRNMGNYYGYSDEPGGADRWGKSLNGLYAKQLSGTDVALFSRSSNLYGMITSDDPFEYFGSLSLAVRNIDGKSPEMLISNLRDASGGKMETAAKFMSKELRTRNHNKRWVEEMQKEGYSGAVTFASNMFNFWGWQVVAPNVVRDDQWQEFHEIYVEDKFELGLDEWFEEVNPGAQAQLIETMLEASRKEYWQADAETLKTMMERYVELANQYDLLIDNEKLREYLTENSAGFGLDMTLPAMESVASATDVLESSAAESQQIEGQKLDKVEAVEAENDHDYLLYWALLSCFLLMILGAIKQALPAKHEALKEV